MGKTAELETHSYALLGDLWTLCGELCADVRLSQAHPSCAASTTEIMQARCEIDDPALD